MGRRDGDFKILKNGGGGGQKDLHIKGQVRHNGGGVDLKKQGRNPFQSNLGATRDT